MNFLKKHREEFCVVFAFACGLGAEVTFFNSRLAVAVGIKSEANARQSAGVYRQPSARIRGF